MKITKNTLKRLIKEELSAYMAEQEELPDIPIPGGQTLLGLVQERANWLSRGDRNSEYLANNTEEAAGNIVEAVLATNWWGKTAKIMGPKNEAKIKASIRLIKKIAYGDPETALKMIVPIIGSSQRFKTMGGPPSAAFATGLASKLGLKEEGGSGLPPGYEDDDDL